MSKPIHQEVDIAASPQRVYAALTQAEQFAGFTGAPAEIGGDGDTFSCFGGMIVGRNVELVAGARVVQAWRVKTWPEGIYSIVRFALTAQGSGTRLTSDQAGFLDGQREHLDPGWHKMYWEPLRKYLG